MHLFYCPEINLHQHLDEQESLHAVKVLRLKQGTPVLLVDGAGGFYEALITDAHHKKCGFTIVNVQREYRKTNFTIHIAIAPAKSNERNEWFIEKTTELGIDAITFVTSEHSERKNINVERLTKVAVSAMKQSQKAYLPRINEPIPFKKFMTEGSKTSDCKFVAHLAQGKRESLFHAAPQNASYTVLIGPEGDFSDKEIQLALDNNFKAITLGRSRLRTETAGMAACHILNILNDA